MSQSIVEAFRSADGARVEGRLENVMQRKKELQRLYSTLQLSSGVLIEGLKKEIDLSRSEEDALFELAVVLKTIRKVTEELDSHGALANDHLAQIQTRSLRRWDCLGNILILGEPPAPIASSIIPLAFAIAAGNTAILILPFETFSVAEALKAAIRSSIDVEAFAAFAPTSESSKMELISELSGTRFQGFVCQDTGVLAQIESVGLQIQKKILAVQSQLAGLIPVVITRNADIDRAAQHLARSKLSKLTEGCRTCPSYVLVDEFVLEDFLKSLEAAVEASIPPNNSKRSSNPILKTENEWDDRKNCQLEFKEMKILVGSRQPINSGQYLEMLKGLTEDPHSSSSWLPIIPMTSMESAIDLINYFHGDESAYAASIFGSEEESVYLCSFIRSGIKLINHIPLELLVNPWHSIPTSDVLAEFSKPVYIISAFQYALSALPEKSTKLRQIIAENIPLPKQRSGQQVGFFPQGGMVGLGHLVGSLALFGICTWYTVASKLFRGSSVLLHP